jgi:hypothetical protein
MRKLKVSLTVLALTVALTAVTANAQTGIALSTSSTSGITFTPTGSGDLSMAAGVFGTAAGLGAFLGTTGYYSLSGGPVALTLVSSFMTAFANYTASGVLNFEITSGPGGTGTDLLSGTLTLVNLVQAISSGLTNTSAVTDLTITGGTLDGSYPGLTGTSQFVLNLSGLGFLPDLTTGTSTTLKSGSLDPLTTPEPKSMLLYGTGLVLFGIMLRRRLLTHS